MSCKYAPRRAIDSIAAKTTAMTRSICNVLMCWFLWFVVVTVVTVVRYYRGDVLSGIVAQGCYYVLAKRVPVVLRFPVLARLFQVTSTQRALGIRAVVQSRIAVVSCLGCSFHFSLANAPCSLTRCIRNHVMASRFPFGVAENVFLDLVPLALTRAR